MASIAKALAELDAAVEPFQRRSSDEAVSSETDVVPEMSPWQQQYLPTPMALNPSVSSSPVHGLASSLSSEKFQLSSSQLTLTRRGAHVQALA